MAQKDRQGSRQTSTVVEIIIIAWAPAGGEQGGQAPTLEKIRVGMAHPGNFSRGLKNFLTIVCQ